MRTISLVKRLKWSFSGNMNPHALVIGDVDNDNENEFVIGNLNGDLAIFKGQCEDGFPSYICRGLGTITCIAVGDVRNTGKNSVVIINAEGHAHIFDIPQKSKIADSSEHISVDDYLRGGRRTSDSASLQAFRRVMSSNTMLSASDSPHHQQQQQQQFNSTANSQQKPRIYDLGKPNLTLKVPVNVNKILIADIDHDHLNELILARTDRILHAFQLVPSDVSAPYEHVYKGIQTPSVASLSPSASTISLTGLSTHTKQPPQQQQKRPTNTAATTTSTTTKDENNNRKISLLDKNMWVFDGQISSLCTTTHPDRPNEPLLLVAQPGNTFTIIDQGGNRLNRDFTPQNSNSTSYDTRDSSSAKMSASNLTVDTNTLASTTTAAKQDEERIESLLRSQTDGDLPYTFEIYHDPSLDKAGTNDGSGTHFERSNYVVKNWPVLDGLGNNNEDVIDDEVESGAVATEIVIGKRHLLGDSFSSSEVGMLSMDGKFSIYDLKTQTTSQRDLFVTHKLFSLATLDLSASSRLPSGNSKTDDAFVSSSANRYHNGTHTPVSSTSHLRFSSATPRNGSLHEGSRTSSKLSLNGLANRKQVLKNQQKDENSNDEEDEIGDEETRAKSITVNSSDSSDNIQNSDASSSLLSSGDEDDNSDYESVPWSEGSDIEDEEPGCDLFVACAWNGVTYLIDWSKKLDSNTDENAIKYQLVKFAFEGRVCAFTAGLYSVENHANVPCLFYVDFEDQIYVYYDVRIAPGPVTGFIDVIDDDVEEALDRIMGIESGIESLLNKESEQPTSKNNATGDDPSGGRIDLGDGWEGFTGGEDEDDDIIARHSKIDDDPINLADFIHECLYGFQDMKDRMENEMLQFEQSRLSNRLPPGADARRLSDLNITIEPPALEENEMSLEKPYQRKVALAQPEGPIGLYPTNSNISEQSSESYGRNDSHIASWIEGSLINSSIFNQQDSSDDDDADDDSDDISS
ncbi:hypothetical protein BD408DRAFT_263623 [Parasitella parasitica]|nr:hypothetical protein BD408DRAFT_263623 [Parasitella parasitica]